MSSQRVRCNEFSRHRSSRRHRSFRRNGGGLSLLAVLWVTARSAPAVASESDAYVQLRWQRSPSARTCPEQTELEQLVRLRLGRNPFAPTAQRTIDASIDFTGSEWHVELHVHDASGPVQGQRVFDVRAESCAQVVDAVGLAVALAIDPNASIASLPSAAAMSEPASAAHDLSAANDRNNAMPPAQPVYRPSPYAYVPLPTALPAPKNPYSVQLTLRGVGAAGLLPNVAPGLGVAGAIGGEVAEGTLSMAYLPETALNQQFSFGLTTLDLGVCGHAARSRWIVASLCTEAHAGAIHSVVRQLQPLHPGDSFFAALSAGPKIGWRGWAPFFVEIGISAWLAVRRPTFGVLGDKSPSFYEVSEVSGVAFLGVGWTTQ